MDFKAQILNNLEKKFKLKELDSEKRDLYLSRIEKEIRIAKKIGLENHFVITSHIIDSINENSISAEIKDCFINSSLIAFCMNIIKADPVKNNRIFELYVNPERISAPHLFFKVSKAGKYQLISSLLSDFSSLDNSVEIAETDEFLTKVILPEKISLFLSESQLLSFMERNRDKTFKMPQLYYEIISETGNKLVFHEQVMVFLSKFLKIPLEKADLVRRALIRLKKNRSDVSTIFNNLRFLSNLKNNKDAEYIFLKLSEEINQLMWV